MSVLRPGGLARVGRTDHARPRDRQRTLDRSARRSRSHARTVGSSGCGSPTCSTTRVTSCEVSLTPEWARPTGWRRADLIENGGQERYASILLVQRGDGVPGVAGRTESTSVLSTSVSTRSSACAPLVGGSPPDGNTSSNGSVASAISPTTLQSAQRSATVRRRLVERCGAEAVATLFSCSHRLSAAER